MAIVLYQDHGNPFRQATRDFSLAGGRVAVSIEQQYNTDGLGTGRVVWDCAAVLCDYLAVQTRVDLRAARILEVGAGAGLCGIACEKLGCGAVTLTDLPELAPLMARNVELNACKATTVEPLVWGTEDGRRFRGLHSPSLIVASDVFWSPPAFRPLVDTLRDLCGPDDAGDTGPPVCLAYTHRYEDKTRAFFTLVERVFEVEEVDLTAALGAETVGAFPLVHIVWLTARRA